MIFSGMRRSFWEASGKLKENILAGRSFFIMIFISAIFAGMLCLVFTSAEGVNISPRFDMYFIFGIIFTVVSLLILSAIYSRYKVAMTTPSFFIIGLFLIIPVIGYIGRGLFLKIYGDVWGYKLDFSFPFYLWTLGTMVFSSAVLTSDILLKRKWERSPYCWDTSRLKIIMILFIFIAALSTLLALYKIGYIPLFKGNIDVTRFTYDAEIGEYRIKFSRLWLIVYIIAVHLYFIEKRRFYIFIIVASTVLLLVYGNRTYALIPTVYLFLAYLKYKKSIKIRNLVLVVLIAIMLFYSINQIRGSEAEEYKKVTLTERVIFVTFGEWREFSYVMNDFNKSKSVFLKEKIFIGVLAPIFPKQFWMLLGLDKDELLANNAAYYFGYYFGHYAGIRVGVIGECFVGFGIPGVILIMFVVGMLFSFCERRYISFSLDEPRFMMTCFVLAIFMFLPLLTFINITTTVIFFGFFIFLCMILCRKENREGVHA